MGLEATLAGASPSRPELRISKTRIGTLRGKRNGSPVDSQSPPLHAAPTSYSVIDMRAPSQIRCRTPRQPSTCDGPPWLTSCGGPLFRSAGRELLVSVMKDAHNNKRPAVPAGNGFIGGQF